MNMQVKDLKKEYVVIKKCKYDNETLQVVWNGMKKTFNNLEDAKRALERDMEMGKQMGSNIMKNSCWVIKVTFLNTGEVNFNEAYWEYTRCMAAIRNKLKGKAFTMIDEYIYKDLDNDIVYEAKLVDIFND